MDHDSYWMFSHFWWLIFPFGWMIMALAWGWSRHSRANRALDILKTYADQGKDPPPELLKGLQGDWDGGCGSRDSWRYSPQRRMQRGFLFLALAIAFGVMTFHDDGGQWHHGGGLFIPMVIFAALAFSNFLSLFLMSRGWPPNSNWPPNDRDRR